MTPPRCVLTALVACHDERGTPLSPAVLAAPDGEVLGCHLLGYEASTTVHEAVVGMRQGDAVADIADTIHAHPTLNKAVEAAFDELA
jgi:pyruvate/2-oxoglutarate dehydrogenase complex dihydrolipoamide dehydrogenase (E3) component